MKPIEGILIKESLTELETLLKNTPAHIKPRVKMLIALKTNEVLNKSQLAQQLDVAYNSVSKWLALYSTGGIQKILEMNRGLHNFNNPKFQSLTPEIFNAIEVRHSREPFQSYVELHEWLKINHSPAIKYSTLIKYIEAYFGNRLSIKRMLQLTVTESLLDLETLSVRSLPRMKPRVKMLIILRKKGKISRSELANELKVSYGSILKWSVMYKTGGVEKLMEYKRLHRINIDVFNYIRNRFADGTFTNFSDLYREIKKEYMPGIQYYTLHRYLHRHFHTEIDAFTAASLPVKETRQELQAMLKKTVPYELRLRIKMLITLKDNPLIGKTELAIECGVAVGSVFRWASLYKQGGIEMLLDMKKRGRKLFELPVETHKLLEKKLKYNPAIGIKELHKWFLSVYTEGMTYNKLYRYVHKHFHDELQVSKQLRVPASSQAYSRVA